MTGEEKKRAILDFGDELETPATPPAAPTDPAGGGADPGTGGAVPTG